MKIVPGMALFGDREHDINIQAFFVAGRMTILFALMLLLLPQRLLSQQIQRHADGASGIGAALSQASTLCALSTQGQARSVHGSYRHSAKFYSFVQSANLLEA